MARARVWEQVRKMGALERAVVVQGEAVAQGVEDYPKPYYYNEREAFMYIFPIENYIESYSENSYIIVVQA